MMTNPDSIDLPSLIGNGASRWTLDPSASSIEFHVKHFWGIVTVHGHFDTITGVGAVHTDGTASGEIRIAADSVSTKNKKRDKHLRSDDFFGVTRYPTVTIRASVLMPIAGTDLRGQIMISAAGHQQAVDTVVHVISATADEVTLHADATVDRTSFDMTWSPLGMASPEARAEVTARFVRANS
jgi:polyisoprenoid-binding protein YceI